MCGPERRILQIYSLYLYVFTVAYINQAWALFVLVSAGAVPLAAQPKLLVILQAITVNGTLAGYCETIKSVCIYKGSEVCACFAFYACLAKRVVADEIRSHKHAAVLYVKMGALLEYQTSGHIYTLWHDNHATSVLCSLVYESLYFRCMHTAVREYTVIGKFILLPKFA